MIELFHWEPNGDSLKLLIYLKEKAIDFESRYVDVFRLEQYAPDHLKRAPMGQLPVLVHASEILAEPKLVLEYLADAFPDPRLAPGAATSWYDLQEWIRYADAQLGPAVNLLGWHTAMLPAMGAAEQEDFLKKLENVPVKEQQAGWAAVVRDAESMEDTLENARGKMREALTRMESTLARSAWLATPEYSIADINAFAIAHVLPQLMPADVNAQKTPKVMDWLQRIGARPAVQAAHAMRRNTSHAHSYMPV